MSHVKTGFGLMFGAGALSGLLGIGSGAVKVLAMDQVMRMPFKVSTTTSNFMIGVTAAASAGIYLSRGYIDPGLAMPVMLGVLGGSMLGARLLAGRPNHNAAAIRRHFLCALLLRLVTYCYDAGEAGAPNVTVVLDGRFSVQTDASGRFDFPAVATGHHVISVVPDNLPLPWVLAGDGRAEVVITTRDRTDVNIAAQRMR